MNKRLILTVGLPRSGKTTWAREQIKKGIPVIESDAIWVAGGYREGMKKTKKDFEHVGRIFRATVKSLFISGHDTVIVVYDHLSRKDRESWVSESGYWTRGFKIFDTSYKDCKQRMIDGNLEDWIPSLNEAVSKMEPIIKEEIRPGEGIIR